MQINKKYLRKNYTSVLLFEEDLEKIIDAFKNLSENVFIKTKDYTFSELSEFFAKYQNQTLTNVEVYTNDPSYVKLDLQKTSASLYSSDDDTNSTGVFYKIDAIISSTLRRPVFLYSYWFYIVAIVFVNFFVNHFLSAGYAAIIGIFLILLTLRVSYINLLHFGEIVIGRRGDYKSFFIRKKDELLVGFILVIATIVITTYFPDIQKHVRLLLIK